jgi:dTDP-4-dehydrorhamnose 3,5-epimerase
MEIISTSIEGAFIIKPIIFKDDRGTFIKTFHGDIFSKNGLVSNFKESFYSTSKKNVLRGMHFQGPPHDHAKIVYVTKGSIIDVILDIRSGSPSYGKYFECELSSNNGLVIYIPTGCAHGFLSLEDESCVIYSHSTAYMPELDSGIHYDSFGFNWDTKNPIISERDHKLVAFPNFISPFIHKKKE